MRGRKGEEGGGGGGRQTTLNRLSKIDKDKDLQVPCEWRRVSACVMFDDLCCSVLRGCGRKKEALN